MLQSLLPLLVAAAAAAGADAAAAPTSLPILPMPRRCGRQKTSSGADAGVAVALGRRSTSPVGRTAFAAQTVDVGNVERSIYWNREEFLRRNGGARCLAFAPPCTAWTLPRGAWPVCRLWFLACIPTFCSQYAYFHLVPGLYTDVLFLVCVPAFGSWPVYRRFVPSKCTSIWFLACILTYCS